MSSSEDNHSGAMDANYGCNQLAVFHEPTRVLSIPTGETQPITSLPVSRICDEYFDPATHRSVASLLPEPVPDRYHGGTLVWSGPEQYVLPEADCFDILSQLSIPNPDGLEDSWDDSDRNAPGNAKSLFPYPGGKGDYADLIMSHLPDHRCYVEPFCGSATIFLNKEPSPSEVINDLNEDVVTFFEVYRERPGELIDWLEAVPYSRSLYEDWVEPWVKGERPETALEHAGRFFVLRHMQSMGKLGTVAGWKTKAEYSSARTFHNARKRLDTFAERFSEVAIENMDWSEVVSLYDHPRSLFFCDPPYPGSEDMYPTDTFDHERFASVMENIEGDCIISYDDVPPAFDREAFTIVSQETSRRMGGQQAEATERLLLNFDPQSTTTASAEEQQTLSDMV